MDEINDLEGQNGKTSHFCFFQKVQRFLSDNLSVLSDTVICDNVGNFWKLLKIAKNTANLIFMLWSHTPSSFYEPQTTFFITAFLRYFWCILEKFQMVANFFLKKFLNLFLFIIWINLKMLTLNAGYYFWSEIVLIQLCAILSARNKLHSFTKHRCLGDFLGGGGGKYTAKLPEKFCFIKICSWFGWRLTFCHLFLSTS